jgi:CAAX prenyl protease-like protein
MTAILAIFSRHVIDFRVRSPLATILIGALVFVLWIGPDALFPAYRSHWLFSNSVVGVPKTGLGDVGQGDGIVLALRAFRAAIIVPILEELFWRAWLMRWIINPDFEQVRLGEYSPKSFWIVAALFASEHGSYWEVGLVAGIIYNWWMVRTRSLGDLILAHGITNALLSAYVVWGKHWEYWA